MLILIFVKYDVRYFSHVQKIVDGWDDTKLKAQERLNLLIATKAAWEGYAEGKYLYQIRRQGNIVSFAGSEGIVAEFEKAEEEMEKIKKKFDVDAAKEDLAKRKEIYEATKAQLESVYNKIKSDYDTMAITLPDDKKTLLKKELEALTEKMSILLKFEEKVAKIEDFCQNLECFDNTSKSLDDWMKRAATELDNIKNHSHQMVPEDRVAVCMELQEDIAAKVALIEESIAQEQELLPQGDSVPKEAAAHKEELARIHKFTLDLQVKVKQETANFSEDVKFWAEYRTGIKSFTPWLEAAETETADGLGKPGDLPQALALYDKISLFEKKCLMNFKVIDNNILHI